MHQTMTTSKRPVALITGASSGIGAATARALAGAGYAVALAARRGEALEQLCVEIRAAGGEALAITCDLCDPGQIAAMAAAARALGPIEVLVNNAGVGVPHRAWRAEEEQIADVLGTNLLGPMRVVREVAPQMVERRRGHIVNIGSVAAHLAMPGQSLYCASKAGLRTWSKALGRELHGAGVKVSLIAPGYIRTPMTRDVRLMPMPGPEVVARAVLRALRRPRREQVVPAIYVPAIWLDWFMPWVVDLAARLIARPVR
jgi:short-subunit dehydrogenase